MSRVPSSLQRRRRREPETSPPRREDALRPARSCRLGGQGPGLRSLGHRPPPGPCVCAGRAAALFRRGEARPARNCPSPPQAPRERASAADSSSAASARAGSNRGPPAGLRAPGSGTDPGHHPDDEPRLGAPSGHGSSRELAGARLQEHREREKGVTAGPPRGRRDRHGPPFGLGP